MVLFAAWLRVSTTQSMSGGQGQKRCESKACRKQGLPTPVFEASANRFTDRFRKDPYTKVRLKYMRLKARPIIASATPRSTAELTTQDFRIWTMSRTV